MRYNRFARRRGLIESKSEGFSSALANEKRLKKNDWDVLVSAVEGGFGPRSVLGQAQEEIKTLGDIRRLLADGVLADNDDAPEEDWVSEKDAYDIIDQVYSDADLRRLAKDAGVALTESRYRRGRRMFESKGSAYDESLARERGLKKNEWDALVRTVEGGFGPRSQLGSGSEEIKTLADVRRLLADGVLADNDDADSDDWISEKDAYDIIDQVYSDADLRKLAKDAGVRLNESRFRRGGYLSESRNLARLRKLSGIRR